MSDIHIFNMNVPKYGRVIYLRPDGTITTEFGNQIIGRYEVVFADTESSNGGSEE